MTYITPPPTRENRKKGPELYTSYENGRGCQEWSETVKLDIFIEKSNLIFQKCQKWIEKLFLVHQESRESDKIVKNIEKYTHTYKIPTDFMFNRPKFNFHFFTASNFAQKSTPFLKIWFSFVPSHEKSAKT